MVPSGNKLLPEPTLSQIYSAIWSHLSLNQLQKLVHVLSVFYVVVILFPTEYKQWRTEYMSNITITINIDDPVGGHQRSQRLIGLATNVVSNADNFRPLYVMMVKVMSFDNLGQSDIIAQSL